MSEHFAGWLYKEQSLRPHVEYMSYHPDLTWSIRRILLEWLDRVCSSHQYQEETFYMAVYYFDRYMSRTSYVKRTSVQLIGTTCLNIAAKVEEESFVKMKDLARLTDGAYTAKQMLLMEAQVFKKLNWELYHVPCVEWVNALMIVRPHNQLATKIRQLLRQAVLKQEFIRYKPSEIAAAIVLIFELSTVDHVRNSICPDMESVSAAQKWILSLMNDREGAVDANDISKHIKSS